MTEKESLMAMIARLPDNASYDELIYHLHVYRQIKIGLDQVERGEVISDEEMERQLDEWDAEDDAKNRMVAEESR